MSNNNQENNDFALEQVPDNMKRGWVAMFSVLVAIGVDLSSVILGAELAQGLPLDQAIYSVLLGSFLMAILYTICAVVGSSTSLSTSMITKYVFGEIGA
ncbi:MAG: cytosine permease, partial [Peptostreptococcaceae bacterium]